MKKLIILFCMCSVVSQADVLPEGKYMFSAPALFKSSAHLGSERLCDMQVLDDSTRRLIFIDTLTAEYLDFSYTHSGRIKIIGSQVGMGEIGRKVKGSGKIMDGNKIEGKLTVVSGAMGFLLIQRKKSEWCLRPATEAEVVKGLLAGLSHLPNTLYAKRLEPTLENIEKYIFVGAGRGYSLSDRPKIMQMLRDGDLIYTNKKFEQKRRLTGEAVRIPPISPEVETEKIPYKSKEELLQIMESFEEDGVETPPLETSTPDVGTDADSESVPALKHAEPSRLK